MRGSAAKLPMEDSSTLLSRCALGIPPFIAKKARAAGKAMQNATRIAKAAGVPIALGTDAGVGAHGANGHEFPLMVEWGGLTPMELPDGRITDTVLFPFTLHGQQPGLRMNPPKLGEHSLALLQELGYSEQEAQDLLSNR